MRVNEKGKQFKVEIKRMSARNKDRKKKQRKRRG